MRSPAVWLEALAGSQKDLEDSSEADATDDATMGLAGLMEEVLQLQEHRAGFRFPWQLDAIMNN